MISGPFIERPRLAIVIAVLITLAGLLALRGIGVAQFPDIVPPQVSVSATYPGASAEVVEATVAQPIEDQVNGVDQMLYMSSTSGNDGSYSLTVTFAIGSDPDIDTVNIQNRVQLAQARLPDSVARQGLQVRKRSSSFLQVVALFSPNNTHGPLFINNYATINIIDALARIKGVGQGAPVRPPRLQHADLARPATADRARSHARGRDPGDLEPESASAGRPHRCRADRPGAAAPAHGPDQGPAEQRRRVRQHHRPLQSRRFGRPGARPRPCRAGRAERR